MTDMTVLYPMITECAVNLVKIAMTVIFGIIIIPWVKNSAIPWLKEKQLCNLIGKFVRAAEKLADAGTINKKTKLDYVISLLAQHGVKVTPEVRALIESAVGELDDELKNNLSNLANAITGAQEVTVEATVDAEVAADVDDEPCAACEAAPVDGEGE